MKKIMMVFGTRPEAIKMAPLYLKLKEKKHNVIVCVTAQHRELLDQVLELFNITPDYDLDIMKNNQTLDYITSEVLIKTGEVLDKEKPDLILVHGDTTTTFVSALAAFYRKIPVGHVEAGLRTNNIYSPFPEEVNRRLTDSISTLYFAPTKSNFDSLVSEGKNPDKIFITENTVVDAFLMTAEKNSCDLSKWIPNIPNHSKIITLTAHRRESHGEKMETIFNAVKKFALNYPEYTIIYPVHPNPNVLKPAKKILSSIDNIILTTPLPYLPFVQLLKSSKIVLTDSGGIQEEVPSLNIPVLVLRDVTERKEAVSAGTVKLVGTDFEKIYNELEKLVLDTEYYNSFKKIKNPYGTGKACENICKIISQYFDSM